MRVAAPTSQGRAPAAARKESAPVASAEDDFEALMGGVKNAAAHPPARSSAWGDAPSASTAPKVSPRACSPVTWRPILDLGDRQQLRSPHQCRLPRRTLNRSFRASADRLLRPTYRASYRYPVSVRFSVTTAGVIATRHEGSCRRAWVKLRRQCCSPLTPRGRRKHRRYTRSSVPSPCRRSFLPTALRSRTRLFLAARRCAEQDPAASTLPQSPKMPLSTPRYHMAECWKKAHISCLASPVMGYSQYRSQPH